MAGSGSAAQAIHAQAWSPKTVQSHFPWIQLCCRKARPGRDLLNIGLPFALNTKIHEWCRCALDPSIGLYRLYLNLSQDSQYELDIAGLYLERWGVL